MGMLEETDEGIKRDVCGDRRMEAYMSATHSITFQSDNSYLNYSVF